MHHPTTTADLAHARRADLARRSQGHSQGRSHQRAHHHAHRVATPRRGRAPALLSVRRFLSRLVARQGSTAPVGPRAGAGIEPACSTC